MGISAVTNNRTKIIVGIGILAVCTGIGSLLAFVVTSLTSTEVNENVNIMKIVLCIGQISTFVLSAVICAYVFEKKSFHHYASISFSIDMVLLIKLLALLMIIYPIAGLSASAMAQLPWPNWMKSLDDKNFELLSQLMDMSSIGSFIINLFIIAILPGIGEEMLFRGILQRELQMASPHSTKPIWIAAFIFAVFHLEPTGLFTKMMIGVVLGFAYYITGNLLYAIIIHSANNALQLTMIYLRPSIMEETNIAPPDLMQITAALLTLPLIILLTKHIKTEYSWMKSSRSAV